MAQGPAQTPNPIVGPLNPNYLAGEVLYWDLVEAEVVRSFSAHSGVVCSLAMHPEGKMLLTSSLDGTVKVWGVPGAGA